MMRTVQKNAQNIAKHRQKRNNRLQSKKKQLQNPNNSWKASNKKILENLEKNKTKGYSSKQAVKIPKHNNIRRLAKQEDHNTIKKIKIWTELHKNNEKNSIIKDEKIMRKLGFNAEWTIKGIEICREKIQDEFFKE